MIKHYSSSNLLQSPTTLKIKYSVTRKEVEIKINNVTQACDRLEKKRGKSDHAPSHAPSTYMLHVSTNIMHAVVL